ncbi:hypothetical protein [Paramicrobacterium fandaimingii]|uniref:hypothetical protein n=1 Tax=Paramicrobacterium fandaimingii TaxID=2708079 RepID=UPI00141EED3C|nr:hypothetical protein [Microbacterium fandaimingii]
MFGLRRRHRKVSTAPAALPEPTSGDSNALDEERLFDAVHQRLEEFMGVDGAWALVRRDPEKASDDAIFSSMSTILLAKDITKVFVGAERRSADVESDAPAVTAPEQAEPAVTPAPRDSGLRTMIRPVPRDDEERSQVDVELTTIATWADPQRHDPDYVDPQLLSSPTAEREIRGA